MTLKKLVLAISVLIPVIAPPLLAQDLKIQFHRVIDLHTIAEQNQSQYNALYVSTQARIYLLDRGLNRVVMLDTSGQKINELGGFGWENEQFDLPTDIWAGNALDVFIADYNNGRIQRFDRNLNYVSSIVSEQVSESRYQFNYPLAVAWSTFGDLFVLEEERNRILLFDELGNPLRSFGDFDQGQGQLVQPIDISLDKKNNAFVLDKGAQAIIQFDYYGNFLQRIPLKPTIMQGKIACSENIIVLLLPLKRTLIFYAQTGKEMFSYPFEMYLSGKQSSTERLGDLCVQSNWLYVLDDAKKQIAVFQLSKTRK